MVENLKVNEGQFYFAYNPQLKQRLTYIRRGNYLICLVDGHKIEYDYVGAKQEEIQQIQTTIKILNKEIQKREELIKKELEK